MLVYAAIVTICLLLVDGVFLVKGDTLGSSNAREEGP
jgi:hypothetical protein